MSLIKNKWIGLFIYSIFWFLFLEFVFENSYEVIDPCASTPSTEFSDMIFIAAFILVLLFFYLYNGVARELSKSKRIVYCVVVLFGLPLFFAWLNYQILEVDFIKNLIKGIALGDKVYEVDCYNDILVTSTAAYLLNSIMVFIFSCLIIQRIKKR
ncbi:hypothetical protein [Pedobacter sp. MW01-1-1]|uniref:hypothetical protein n=1 Tax=Pedobacter sp. MW01-1-1 TaxID=3383027 RepID=UPI003FED831D